MKKKLFILLGALLAASLLCACGSKPAESGVPNPVHEVTADALMAETGLEFVIPEGAEDLRYSWIGSDDDDAKLAQANFALDGVAYTIRCRSGAEAEDISGLYLNWAHTEKAEVGYNEANLCYNDDGQGCVTWFDVVPGLNYSVACDKGGVPAELAAFAAAACPPVQGDA